MRIRVRGRYAYDIDDLHRKYGIAIVPCWRLESLLRRKASTNAIVGDVVRYAPNELSFGTAQSAKDIYGHAFKGHQPFVKGLWYTSFTGKGETPGLATETVPEAHRITRKNLSHAFSAQALSEQTPLIMKYIDMFIAQVTTHGQTEQGIPVDNWFMWLTFDVVGDLAFGESFDAVAKAQSHFWIDMVLDSAFAASMVQVLARMPIAYLAAPFVLPGDLQTKFKKHNEMTREKIMRRLNNDRANERMDLFAHILKDKSLDFKPEFFISNASTIITAGSETTATSLAATTFFLLSKPKTLQRLQDEVRSAFTASADINQLTTGPLSYMLAVIEESLRLFPPIGFGLQRNSPGALVDGTYVPKGVCQASHSIAVDRLLTIRQTVVSTAGYSVAHDKRYFLEPYEFHPERWLPTDHSLYESRFDNDVKEASRPFSQGPRGCIGINLAYLEMRITLAKMVWHFDWELKSHGIDWRRDTTMNMLWKKPEVMVKYTPVKR